MLQVAGVSQGEAPSFRHLLRLSDTRGIFEHASFTVPRYEHGYCTDDNARLLIAATRADPGEVGAKVLSRVAMSFLLQCQNDEGRVRNRMTVRGTWADDYSCNDAWGRAQWAFGTVAARGHERWMREMGSARFRVGLRATSDWLHSNCFAALGASEILGVDPGNLGAARFLQRVAHDVVNRLPPGEWHWPEDRLRYANGALPDVVIAAGVALGDEELLDAGLTLLDWLWRMESHEGRLSVTPVGGRGPGEAKPAFDQQPIEVATLAEACARAWACTGDSEWERRLRACADWFLGANDGDVMMLDPLSGGGYDGLTCDGVNINQGAESTLAMVSTLRLAGPAPEETHVLPG